MRKIRYRRFSDGCCRNPHWEKWAREDGVPQDLAKSATHSSARVISTVAAEKHKLNVAGRIQLTFRVFRLNYLRIFVCRVVAG